MLVDPPIENLLKKSKNRYDLAIAIAKRNRQLIEGADPLVKEGKDDTYASLACKELEADRVVAVAGIVDPVVPIRPEILEVLNAEPVIEADDDDWQIKVKQEPEEVEAPVSKIKVINPEDMFTFPEYEDEDDEEEDVEDDDYEYSNKSSSKRVPGLSNNDEEVNFNFEEDDDYASDEDLETLDSSIDEIDYEDEDDILSGFQDYSDYDDEDDM